MSTKKSMPKLNAKWYNLLAALRGPDYDNNEAINKMREKEQLRPVDLAEWKRKYTLRIRVTLGFAGEFDNQRIRTRQEALRLMDEVCAEHWAGIEHYAHHLAAAFGDLAELLPL